MNLLTLEQARNTYHCTILYDKSVDLNNLADNTSINAQVRDSTHNVKDWDLLPID